MRTATIITAAVAALAVTLGAALPEPALADNVKVHGRYKGGHYYGGHPKSSFSIHLGVPFPYYGPYYRPYYYPPPYAYPYPYYYGPPVVAVPSQPPVYIEKGGSAEAPDEGPSYWYYCPDSRAYYPYVKQCPGGWERQVPQPPPDAR
ncbi:MAG: hypothetical protein ACOZDY_01030 [Pseudomonadota bacterium]